MSASKKSWLRRQVPAFAALVLVAAAFLVARPPASSADTVAQLAKGYGFEPMSIALPGGYTQQTVRKVNQKYKHIDWWISSVGAGVALNDLDGDGLANDICLSDPRTDQVYVAPAPGRGQDRYAPFALTAGTLPTTDTMAPMGCQPGDFNEDGRVDLLVYLWGRTPILHLAKADAKGLSASAYQAVELVPGVGTRTYTGPQWNTNSVTYADFDGDGHADIFIGNYFPDGPILDPSKNGGVVMNDSMSHGLNGGTDHVFRFTGGTAGAAPTASFQRLDDAIPDEASRGWALGSSATDLDGDSLPELYIAHDFGPDRLLYNRSTPGHVSFALVTGSHGPLTPKSKVVGHDSFKGMGVDFGDIDGDGLYDMFVSNITTSFGIEESHFAYVSDAKDTADVRRSLQRGHAPFEDKSAPLNVAWSGWGWDVKIDDFNNSGNPVIAQSTGFVRGEVNRWPVLQELATANDELLRHPEAWPNVGEGDDVAGHQHLAFFARGADGKFTELAKALGIAVPVPTRGIASGDTDGDGLLDFVVARQWDAPVFYHNTSPATGAYLDLKLLKDIPVAAGSLPGAGTASIGAEVTVTTPDGRTFVNRVDGGSGHAGKRSTNVHIGLGTVSGPVRVRLQWRDTAGTVHQQTLQTTPGAHTLVLGSTAQEK